MLDPTRDALTLISCGALVIYAGVYTLRVGMHGEYLQRFQLWGWKRKYTGDPSPADRRLHQIFGWIAVVIGLAAVAGGIVRWVQR